MMHTLRTVARRISGKARIWVFLMVVLAVAERLVWALAALGLEKGLTRTAVAATAATVLWTLRSALRRLVVFDLRVGLGTELVQAPLTGDPATLPAVRAEEAEAALFEGRDAVERLVSQHLPNVLADAIAGAFLLSWLADSRSHLAVIAIAGVCLAMATRAYRARVLSVWDAVWQRWLSVARASTTCVHAAAEIVASGRARDHAARVARSVEEWAALEWKADWVGAALQRVPTLLIVVAAVAFVGGLRRDLPRLDEVLRLAAVLPPIAGALRGAFSAASAAPKLSMLVPLLDRVATPEPTGNAAPPENLAEIAFDLVTFGYESRSSSNEAGAAPSHARPPVLRSLSFTWTRGTLIALCGPNGTGKSTVLRLLLGLARPSAGRVVIAGRDLSDLDVNAWRRRVAYLPQRPYLPTDATVAEVLDLSTPGLGEAEARAALERVGLWRRLGVEREPLATRIDALSAGERQRLALARVVARSAEVILLDEPDENFDADGRRVLAELLREWARTALVVVVTHDPATAAMASRVVELARV